MPEVQLLRIIDWSQFLPTLLATFFGCIIAVILTIIYDSVRKHIDVAESLLHLEEELKSIKETIVDIKNKEAESFLCPLYTPVYSSLVSSHRFVMVLDSKRIKDFDEKQGKICCFALIYEYISEYNLWQNMRTQNRKQLDTEDDKRVREYIDQLGDDIVKLIDMFVGGG